MVYSGQCWKFGKENTMTTCDNSMFILCTHGKESKRGDMSLLKTREVVTFQPMCNGSHQVSCGSAENWDEFKLLCDENNARVVASIVK